MKKQTEIPQAIKSYWKKKAHAFRGVVNFLGCPPSRRLVKIHFVKTIIGEVYTILFHSLPLEFLDCNCLFYFSESADVAAVKMYGSARFCRAPLAVQDVSAPTPKLRGTRSRRTSPSVTTTSNTHKRLYRRRDADVQYLGNAPQTTNDQHPNTVHGTLSVRTPTPIVPNTSCMIPRSTSPFPMPTPTLNDASSAHQNTTHRNATDQHGLA